MEGTVRSKWKALSVKNGRHTQLKMEGRGTLSSKLKAPSFQNGGPWVQNIGPSDRSKKAPRGSGSQELMKSWYDPPP